MSSNLLAIAASGAKAAEIALDLTGQNIANASTQGYVRRSANSVEVAPASTWSTANDVSLSGVTVSGIVRNADPFLQAEARNTASNAAGAKATVSGLTNVEVAVEDSGLFTAVGNNINFALGTGSTATGNSGATLDVSTVLTTSTLPFKVVSLIYDPPGANGADTTTAYNWAYVTFNWQDYKSTTGI
jgi:flagellar hook-associated protein 1 FlgK